MAGWRFAASEALSPVLDNFRRIQGQILRTVWRVDDEGSVDRVILGFGEMSFTVKAREDDDTVEFWTEETAAVIAGIDASKSQPWCGLIGKPFGWGWVAINQQGYCDGILLSFGGIDPQVMLNVIASSTKEITLGWPH